MHFIPPDFYTTGFSGVLASEASQPLIWDFLRPGFYGVLTAAIFTAAIFTGFLRPGFLRPGILRGFYGRDLYGRDFTRFSRPRFVRRGFDPTVAACAEYSAAFTMICDWIIRPIVVVVAAVDLLAPHCRFINTNVEQ